MARRNQQTQRQRDKSRSGDLQGIARTAPQASRMVHLRQRHRLQFGETHTGRRVLPAVAFLGFTGT
ncbi:MAG: hypothetical protein U0744_20455 [Gemmataceae bacterium]